MVKALLRELEQRMQGQSARCQLEHKVKLSLVSFSWTWDTPLSIWVEGRWSMAVDLPEPWRERGRNERGDERGKKMRVF